MRQREIAEYVLGKGRVQGGSVASAGPKDDERLVLMLQNPYSNAQHVLVCRRITPSVMSEV